MNRQFALIMLALGGFVAAQTAFAAPPPEPATARLIADVAAIKPGEAFTIGVLFDITPGWHIYWINPGDSGLATSIKLKLPAGFTAGPIQFPTPMKFTQPGNEVAYGYERSVLLTARIHAPVKVAGDVKIEASNTWLVCQQTCLPGHAKLDLTLPVDPKAKPSSDAALFQQWARQLPVDAADSPEVEKLQWDSDVAHHQATLTVTWKPDTRPQSIAVFPTPDDSLDVRTVSTQTQGKTTRIILALRILAGQSPATSALPAVLGYSIKDGQRRGVKTEIPLAGAAENK